MAQARFTYRVVDADVYCNGKLIGRVIKRPETLHGEPGPFFDWFDRAGGKGEARTPMEALNALKARYPKETLHG
ncbi:MAG: hypothetical protein AAGE61_00790 [Pseudomonadota bacterium]